VAAHRVQRYPHRLLLLGLRLHHLAALIVAAIGADEVRQYRLVALVAVLHLRWRDVMMAPPRPLPGVRRAPFRYGHVKRFPMVSVNSRQIMLDEAKAESRRATKGVRRGST